MCKLGATATAAAILLMSWGTLAAAPKNDPPPSWAFILVHDEPDPTPASTPITVPGSTLHLTEKAIDDLFAAADWFPEDHPPMPEVVAHGRRPQLRACGYCHLPTGVGDPASAALAGLPVAYIEQQLAEFRAGRRQCPMAEIACTDMPQVARQVSAEEGRAAAIYFSQLPYNSRIRVLEAALVPKTRYGDFYPVRLADGGEEAIGRRILEVPDSAPLEDDLDWRGRITAYVPPGSVASGKALVASGAGALPCASCHGARLQGAGMVPPLAGRPPTYIVRQLYDIQYGYRRGPALAPMEPEVAHLTAWDRIAIAAYIASLPTSTQ